MERTLNLCYNELVVGADLSALYYSYIKKCPVIFTRYNKPYKYGFNESYEKEINVYDFLHNLLSLNGLSPFGDKIDRLRLESNNLLKASLSSGFSIEIAFNTLIISDDYKLDGLPESIGKTDNNNCVIDYLSVDERCKFPSVQKFNRDIISTIFFTNKLIKGRRHHKEFIINSKLSDEDLLREENSESYMRLRLLRMFYPDIEVFIHYKRDIYPLGKTLYNLPKNIKVLTKTPKEILKLKRKHNIFMDRVEEELWKRYKNLTDVSHIWQE